MELKPKPKQQQQQRRYHHRHRHRQTTQLRGGYKLSSLVSHTHADFQQIPAGAAPHSRHIRAQFSSIKLDRHSQHLYVSAHSRSKLGGCCVQI